MGKAEIKKIKIFKDQLTADIGTQLFLKVNFFWKNKGKITDVENETVYRVLPFILNCTPALGQKTCMHGGGRLNMNKIPVLPLINVSKRYIFFNWDTHNRGFNPLNLYEFTFSSKVCSDIFSPQNWNVIPEL